MPTLPLLDELLTAVNAAEGKPGADKVQAAWTRVARAVTHLETTLAATAARNEANERKATLRKHAAELEAELAAVKAEMRPAKEATAAAPELLAPEVLKEIREWALANGVPASRRGRLAATVIDQYNAAQAERELVSA